MKKTLVYVASSPRSGSTILTNLLGNHPEIFNVGELCNVHSFLNGGRIGQYFGGACPCGASIRECSVWGQVIENALKKCNVSGVEFITRLQDLNLTPQIGRFLPIANQAAAIRDLSKEGDKSIQVGHHCFALLDEIVRIQGVPVVVDSSKNCSNLAIYLAHRPDDWDIKVIHILRDPRATAVSMIKGCRRAGVDAPSFYRASLGWVRVNSLIAELLKPLGGANSLIMSFEEFCSFPQDILDNVGLLIGVSLDLNLLSERSRPRHDIGGSRSVSTEATRIEISLDQQWKIEMNLARQLFSRAFSSRIYRRIAAGEIN
jgi:hypothetical protein